MARSSFIATSPEARGSFDRLMMLSSSPLPDITEFAPKKPKATTLRSGSAAVPIPASATKTFTSAADLLRSAQAGADDSADFIDEPERPAPRERTTKPARKTNKAPKRVAKEVIELSSDGVTPNGNKDDTHTRHEGGIRDGTEGSPLGAKPWKRYKALADLGDKDKDMSAEAVEPQAKAKVQRKKKTNDETVSKYIANKDGATRPRTTKPAPEPINLEPAVQRRGDWTPPPEDTHPETFPTPTAPLDANQERTSPALPRTEDGSTREDIFRNLHEAYALRVTDQTERVPNNAQPIALGKRKVIDMTSGGQPSKQTSNGVSPTKTKAPKKKPRTITELATAAYAPKPVDLQEDPIKEGDSILEYFDVDRKGNVSKATTAKGKGKTTKVTKKKAPPKQPVLLSPQAAMRQSARQDFVFGTSSQLVREESPTFLRDLQAALRASNITTSEESVGDLPHPRDLALESMKRSGGLWSVSARDEDGELVDVGAMDLVGSHFPEDDDAVAILDPWKDLPPELPAVSGTETETAEPSLIEIESMPVATSNISSQPPVPKSHFFLTQPKVTIKAAAVATAADSSESLIKDTVPLITDLLQEGDAPPPSNQEQSEEDIRQISPAMPRKIQKTRLNYELFTDSKLAKEVSSFGFKPVKSRRGMLALLDQCWESRSRAPIGVASFSTSALSSSPKGKKKVPAVAPTTTTSPPPKKPRARTKKVPDAAASDSAAATEGASNTSSPKKRGRPRKDASMAAGPSNTTMMPPPPKAQPAASTPKRRKATIKPRAEIADSDLDSDDSAGLSSPEKVFTSPGGRAVDMSINEDTEISLDLSPTAQQSVLFNHITRAVTSAPRTTDPENPSWHEKMLMYDPIILEDLATWLNTGQLTRVGYDGEASPMDVKKWCESRSICCLWRGTSRGKERKRL
ncbi:structure-specific endonuclease subunit SLX4 [Diaporthe sp. PMI_573]|nr:structure-specific endonuclease subunit SLX4 [Diaporthaceae sp. PMI_573]